MLWSEMRATAWKANTTGDIYSYILAITCSQRFFAAASQVKLPSKLFLTKRTWKGFCATQLLIFLEDYFFVATDKNGEKLMQSGRTTRFWKDFSQTFSVVAIKSAEYKDEKMRNANGTELTMLSQSNLDSSKGKPEIREEMFLNKKKPSWTDPFPWIPRSSSMNWSDNRSQIRSPYYDTLCPCTISNSSVNFYLLIRENCKTSRNKNVFCTK